MKEHVPATVTLCLLPAILAIAGACSPPAAAPPPPSPQTDSAPIDSAPIDSAPTDSAPAETGTFVPDPNESPEAVARYREARRLIAQGQRDRARTLLEEAAARFPESRHLHQVYAELLWHESKGTDPALLRQSAAEAVRASELGLRSGRVDYTLTARLAATLGRTGDRDTLDRIFHQLLAKDPSSTVYLDYATGLALLGEDPRAEDAFKQATRSDPNGDAAARYGEWLLDRRREREALEILPQESPVHYIHFLRGVALERLGRTEEAGASYGRYREYSRTFPAPARFRISGSTVQSGIRFGEKTGT